MGTGDLSTEPPDDTPDLSILELTLLRNLKVSRDEGTLSRLTKVDKRIVGIVLDRLFEKGYIGDQLKVTEKGWDTLNSPSVRLKQLPSVDLTPLELGLLRRVPWRKDKELSEWANVDRKTVSEKLRIFHEQRLVTDKRMLTEKGFSVLYKEEHEVRRSAAVKDSTSSQDREQAPRTEPTRTVVIQREIVKVACKYCGSLNELATSQVCSRCGAKIS
jgi:hypothetical protein